MQTVPSTRSLTRSLTRGQGQPTNCPRPLSLPAQPAPICVLGLSYWHNRRDICTSMFRTALLTIINRWEQAKCPPIWINKMRLQNGTLISLQREDSSDQRYNADSTCIEVHQSPRTDKLWATAVRSREQLKNRDGAQSAG